jgi:hypothetical protein
MDSRQAIQLGIDSGNMVTMAYLDDLTDEQMLHRPHAECNHIKWQLGHLISSENQIIGGVAPGSMPALPEGFADKYSKETAKSDDASAFDSKEILLSVYQQQRQGTLAALENQSDENLDKSSPEEMQAFAPTVASAFNLIGGHLLMHAGQWAVIRRQLGKPPLF